MKEKNVESLKDVVIPLVKMPMSTRDVEIRRRCEQLAYEIRLREKRRGEHLG
jgi:hypothetical protein